MKLRVGEKIRIFPETDAKVYSDYFKILGYDSEITKNYIKITGYSTPKLKRGRKVKNGIGDRIKYVRTQMYFSVEELAEEIGATPEVIYDWEYGRVVPKGKEFDAFLEFSGATKEYIIDGRGEWVDEIQAMMKELHKEGK